MFSFVSPSLALTAVLKYRILSFSMPQFKIVAWAKYKLFFFFCEIWVVATWNRRSERGEVAGWSRMTSSSRIGVAGCQCTSCNTSSSSGLCASSSARCPALLDFSTTLPSRTSPVSSSWLPRIWCLPASTGAFWQIEQTLLVFLAYFVGWCFNWLEQVWMGICCVRGVEFCAPHVCFGRHRFHLAYGSWIWNSRSEGIPERCWCSSNFLIKDVVCEGEDFGILLDWEKFSIVLCTIQSIMGAK